MKDFFRKLPVKAACFILSVICLGVTVLCTAGGVVLAEVGFYKHTPESLLYDVSYDRLEWEVNNIMHSAINFVNGKAADPLENNTDFSTKSTNLRFQVYDPEGNIIFRNIAEPLDKSSEQWEYTQYFNISFTEEGSVRNLEWLGQTMPASDEQMFAIRLYLDSEFKADDVFAFYQEMIDFGYSMRYAVYPIGIVSLILAVCCFVMLICTAGRREGSSEVHPGFLNKVPSDLLFCLSITAGAFVIGGCLEIFYYYDITVIILVVVAVYLILADMFIWLCMNIAVRVKEGTIFSNTLIWKCCGFIWRYFKWMGKKLRKFTGKMREVFLNVPLIWRTLIIFCGISFLEMIFIMVNWCEMDNYMVFWLIEKMLLAPAIFYGALTMRKLQQGGKALAEGDLSFQIDTESMSWDFKKHGENLNSIAAGMASAVEKRLQSERMKTELITNVSHDIKTPLTSIINYAGLIEEEPCSCEHHKEYSAVLIRKSAHLKHLLDDLVEVSKAATGNLEVMMAPCEAGVLLTQVAGEFEQRCETAGLQLVVRRADENLRIMADSRRIWRVFENLMTNACKYSLSGSRVYLTLEHQEDNAVFTFRNTSAAALDVTPEELMERFTRGDSSRTTEGNGLGLSIAGSLTELQNGKMELTIDGDLFKVCLKFPLIKE